MKKFLKSIDLQDVQLVAGIASLGYGLFLVYPPAMFITLGILFITPVILPLFRVAR
jgi:membrane protein YdbS with pleckstrin-like domain